MKRSKSSRILKILSYVLLITGMIVILYPFYLTIITALKTPQESSQSFFSFPQSFYLGNFVNVLQKANYFVFFRNSAVVTLVSVFLIMVLIPMCSYAIARNMEKRYYKTMYFYLLAGIFVPFQVIMVPLVKYLAKLKLCNIPGLIIMCVTLASSQGVFLLVNYIRSVPRDLEEAAYIDGCGTVKAYVKIVLPMIKPILATIFVLNALWVWNDFQMPLLILNQSQDMWTLPLFQYNFKSQYSFDYNLAFASCAVYISTCVYEKYQTKGQSILNVVQLGLGAIVGNLVGGKLIRLLGYEKGYLLMAGITTLMTICALIVYFWKNREQRNGGDVCEI